MRIIHIYPAPSLALALAASATLSGCWIKKTTCRGLNSVMGSTCDAYKNDGAAGEEEPGSVSGGGQPGDSGQGAVPITEEVVETVVGEGYPLTRINPEQLSNNLSSGLLGKGFSAYRFDDQNAGQTIDYFTVMFGVPLGGVDFQTVTTRDPSTKAQTLLVGRVVSSQFASWTFWDELINPGSRVVFTKCDLEHDRPYGAAGDESLPAAQQDDIKNGEVAWNAQLDDLYWRLFSRPPTAVERAAVKATFLSVYEIEQHYPPAAWIAVYYALLSTEEFWHI